MRVQVSTRLADRVIQRLARAQFGVVERGQLLAAGVTRSQIATRLASGLLVEVHRGVYLVGSVPGPHAHEMAALLACGPSAVLSHRSAGVLWSLLSYPAAAPVWITIPPERRATRPGIELRRTQLPPSDIRSRKALTLTSPPRTLFDLAALLDPYALESVVAEAEYRGLASFRELDDQLNRNPGRRGIRALRHVLGLPGGPRRTRSPAERDLLRLLRDRGIEGFETNTETNGYEVDFLWAEAGFVVEVDGYDAHSGRVAFERDRLKLAKLEAAGLKVMLVTGRQVRRDPAGVVQRLLAARDHVSRARDGDGWRPAAAG